MFPNVLFLFSEGRTNWKRLQTKATVVRALARSQKFTKRHQFITLLKTKCFLQKSKIKKLYKQVYFQEGARGPP